MKALEDFEELAEEFWADYLRDRPELGTALLAPQSRPLRTLSRITIEAKFMRGFLI